MATGPMDSEQFERALHAWREAEEEALEAERRALDQKGAAAAQESRHARRLREQADTMLADLANCVSAQPRQPRDRGEPQQSGSSERLQPQAEEDPRGSWSA